jgi:hypothetical protein
LYSTLILAFMTFLCVIPNFLVEDNYRIHVNLILGIFCLVLCVGGIVVWFIISIYMVARKDTKKTKNIPCALVKGKDIHWYAFNFARVPFFDPGPDQKTNYHTLSEINITDVKVL